jgi:serine/threonine protein kinase
MWELDFPKLLRAADREARALKTMDWASDVVVQFRECWIQSPGPFACIVLEWLPKSLTDVVKEHSEAGRGLLPIADVRRWFVHATFGVGALHASGWLHRDIKTSNFLLTNDGKRCKVADLGLGCRMCMLSNQELETPSEVGSICDVSSVLSGRLEGPLGSPLYMSPEASKGNCVIASDIFSLGCVLFEMLVGPDRFRAVADTPYLARDAAIDFTAL